MKAKPLSRKALLAMGALSALVVPMLAQDQKIDLKQLLADVKGSNWKKSKPLLVEAIKPKLAQDADVTKLVSLLDSLDGEENNDDLGIDLDPNDAGGAGPHDAFLASMKGKMSDEDHAGLSSYLKAKKPATDDADGDGDEEELVNKLRELLGSLEPAAMDRVIKKMGKDADPALKTGEADPNNEKLNKENMVTKPAMDAAIKVASEKAAKDATDAALKRAREITAAERAVQPYVGELAFAQDSAEGVYRIALETLGLDVKDVHPSAYRAILEAQPLPDISL